MNEPPRHFYVTVTVDRDSGPVHGAAEFAVAAEWAASHRAASVMTAHTALQARLRQIDTAQDSKVLELEQLPADPADTAAAAMRARFAELHHEREQIETQLAGLDKTTPAAADPALLDQLPIAGDILASLPAALKARLFQTFDLEVLWNKPGQQATVFAEITENTLKAIPGTLNPGQDGYHDTDPNPDAGEPITMGDLVQRPSDHPDVTSSWFGGLGRRCCCDGSVGWGLTGVDWVAAGAGVWGVWPLTPIDGGGGPHTSLGGRHADAAVKGGAGGFPRASG